MNRSGCSPKISDHERFAQVAQRKLAIVSESLRSLTKNDQIALFFVNRSFAHFFAKNEQFAQKANEQIPSPGSKAAISAAALAASTAASAAETAKEEKVTPKKIPALQLHNGYIWFGKLEYTDSMPNNINPNNSKPNNIKLNEI